MTILIIKQKKPWPDKPMRATCNGCGSRLEFTKDDVKFVYNPRDGSFYEFQCPVCPRRVTYAWPKVYL